MLAHKFTPGTKTPLVFIHGFCEDSTVWDNFKTYFTGHPILTVDLPGFGESPVQKDYSLEQVGDQVAQLISEFELKNPIVIGHSMGGYTTCALAKKHESLLSGIALFHSHPFKDTVEKKKNRQKSIDFIERNGAKIFVDTLIKNLFSAENELKYPKEIQVLQDKAVGYPQDAIIEGMKAMLIRENHKMTLEDLKIPVLMMVGKKDRVTTYEVCRKQFVLPKVGMIKALDEIGHMGMMEDADLCSKGIHEFIELVHLDNQNSNSN